MIRPGFFVGLGSNLAPERNVPAVVDHLLGHFGGLWISPVVRTAPLGIDTPHAFLNAVLFVETDEGQARVKAFFNALEEALGRDRSDRHRDRLDRPADLDILMHYRPGEMIHGEAVPAEPYLRPAFLDLCRTMGVDAEGAHDQAPDLATVSLRVDDIPFGTGSRRLRRNRTAPPAR
ncbi:MAG TPA: 2-amino-4-hydroxy-6-hydroxymethyldihydropteridine diphosphokinase [Gammaproteobacteria bacterium]|nr:2-amino-4-hydroxy-6-hydroxymethyldihydropteridine diphosphokinase [Gammaproteobacteria bacterium]